MRKRFAIGLILSLFVTTLASGQEWLMFKGGDGPGKGKHICLLAGDEEYRSEEAMPMLAKILSKHHGFDCSVHFSIDEDGFIAPEVQTSVTGAEQLKKADAIVMSLRFRNWPEEERKHFTDAIERGIPIVGLRTSTHAFRGPLGSFGKRVLGENWVSHWGGHKREATQGVIEHDNANHDVLKGVAKVFGTSDVYEAYPPEDAKILLRGLVLKGMTPDDKPADYEKKQARGEKKKQGVNDPAMAIAWTRTHAHENGKTSRVLCTTMGAATDLTSEGLRRLVVNGVYWGLEMDVPEKTNVAYVGEYKPTMYGFGSYMKGVRPADHLSDTAPTGGPSLDGVNCLVNAGKAANPEISADHHGAKVYFCCEGCLGKFKADPEKFTVMANHQLVASGQFVQKACPISGGKTKEPNETIGGVKVAFCCENCSGKVAEAEGVAAKAELVFSAKAFEKGFEKK